MRYLHFAKAHEILLGMHQTAPVRASELMYF